MTTRRRVAVAATGVQARDAGIAAVADGGNAVDAALAAAFCSMSSEPGIVSLAGGCFVAVWPADGEPVVVDGNVEMPGREASPEQFGGGIREIVTEYGGGVTLHAGHGSVATPGIVPAFALASERFGRLPWPLLLEPATRAAREGYPTSHAGARYLAFVRESLFGADPEAHSLVAHGDGTPLAGGEIARNPALADTLEALAEEGSALFTHGEVARRLVADMAAHGGLIGAADLASYRPVVRRPVRRTVGDWDIGVNPPPSVGGPMLAVMLAELARRGDWEWRDAIEIQQAVLGHRLDVHDLSADLEADGVALLEAVDRHGLPGLPTSPSTAHISAVDSDGTVCAVTMSSGYGAGMCIPGTGILLNNCLGEIELNRRGLHALEPGTRLASNMAPTVGRTADGRALAAGSPGADRITTALMLVLGQGCLHGASLQAAIDRPRLHVRRLPDGSTRVDHEADAGIRAAVAELALASHEYPEPHMYFGGVGAALRLVDGTLEAAGDHRREACVGVGPD